MAYASWRKCDFQVHTPRDPNWTGHRTLGISETNPATGLPSTADDVDGARKIWAEQFVQKCVERGLGAVALTDHHEMIMVPYVQRAIAARKASDPSFDLWLFPGMELTAIGGKQCLILFDGDLSEDWWKTAQAKLSIAYAALDEKAAKAPSVTQLTMSYPDIATELNGIADLVGKFIVLPNLSQGNSHTVLVDKAHADFKRMACVGGYLDAGQTVNSLGSKNTARLSGKDSTWSDRRIYPLPTSDSRSHDFATLGKNNAWIKLAAPTAEAVRQAFLAHHSRIAIEVPRIASLVVSEIVYSGSGILTDVSFALSPELNAIIGGRGSGKSSFLEYVAFGLGRSCYDAKRDHYSSTQRMNDLISDTVVSRSAKIAVTLIQDGAVFKVERGPGTSYQPQITYPNGSTQLLTTKELRALFPAVVYSQGELAEIGKQTGEQTPLSDLLQFVDASYKREDDKSNSDIENARNAVRSAIQSLISHWSLVADLRKTSTRRDALIQRIAALQKTLPTLSPEDQAKVNEFDRAGEFETKRVQASKHATQIATDLDALATELLSERDLSAPIAGKANKVRTHYSALFKTFSMAIATLKEQIAAERKALTSAETDWAGELKSLRTARDGVLEKLGAHKSVTAQIIQLREEEAEVANQIGDLEARISSNGDPSEGLRERLEALRSLSRARADRTVEWALEIEKLSNGKIRAVVEPEADLGEVRDAIDLIASKTGSQEGTRLKELDDTLSSSSVFEILDHLRTESLALLYWRQVGSGTGEEMPKAPNLFKTIGDTERVRTALLERLDTTRIETVAIALPKPKIALSYSDRGKEIAFEKASEGQRAAALLFMLLEQPGGPLIIDQPEGDLDNKIIADLTDKLHTAKQKRQLLFASHNANIVVNGSSELVGHLDVDGQGERYFECTGAIETPSICSVITSTMEGGERAFKDRLDKYGY
ncbi:AAA family ATPase [Rhizobium sp. 9T]|uniref:TrlF family AAA-like ATPase n=1 Tax=Rhizobium croatiense TaxID=2867516 RepID=UPI001C935F1B|nr:AAA family ATPase [Rhizobium croatiense]MBY4611610.1 AAA family ATPase [Rhizobium croatiense]